MQALFCDGLSKANANGRNLFETGGFSLTPGNQPDGAITPELSYPLGSCLGVFCAPDRIGSIACPPTPLKGVCVGAVNGYGSDHRSRPRVDPRRRTIRHLAQCAAGVFGCGEDGFATPVR